MSCVFCDLPAGRLLGQNNYAVWFRDGFPVSRGHSLVITRRHVGSLFETTVEEREALLALLDAARAAALAEFKPDGFNIGVNDGVAAGQTVPHLHIHLIPRYIGDVQDPRGGIRWVVPEHADYWTQR